MNTKSYSIPIHSTKEKNEKSFIHDNFLLTNKTAENLFHKFAENLPIIDYHCHLPIDQISSNHKFENLTQIWLNGDHYKWRAMRANGINEDLITGTATDWDKFYAWAETVPYTVRNPLYHWTHMELKNPFGINNLLLDKTTAEEVWNKCNELLNTDEFTTRGLINKFNVEIICTTDDPVDSLEFHNKLNNDNFNTKVFPAFRPDKGMMIENRGVFNLWFMKLQEVTNKDIRCFSDYIEAIRERHDFFHLNGCRTSDHGIEMPYAEEYTNTEIELIFDKILTLKQLSINDILKFKSAMMYEFGVMDAEKNWVQQLHLGALRNTNSLMYKKLGPDTGYDSMGDFEMARPLAKFLDKLNSNNKLPKTIIYNVNPVDNELIATMIGNFQDGSVAGKIQFGAAWWFLDQKDGIEKQLNALSNMGLLSRFVGMLTDSRSFLSYPRHDYFRRILCNLIGEEIEKGLIPDSEELVAPLIQNICYYNAKNYFDFNK